MHVQTRSQLSTQRKRGHSRRQGMSTGAPASLNSGTRSTRTLAFGRHDTEKKPSILLSMSSMILCSTTAHHASASSAHAAKRTSRVTSHITYLVFFENCRTRLLRVLFIESLRRLLFEAQNGTAKIVPILHPIRFQNPIRKSTVSTTHLLSAFLHLSVLFFCGFFFSGGGRMGGGGGGGA